jgi:Starch-binding associating with outer membrane
MTHLSAREATSATRTKLTTRTVMKHTRKALLGGLMVMAAGCKDFLDVNENPNGPQTVSANLYLAPMLHWMATGPQLDGRFVGRYAQEWVLTGTILSTWDRMGYDPSSDNAAQIWRDVYWTFGQNLVDMTTKAEAEERWDLLGVAKILKAWGWQATTDLHGEIIVKEAIDQSKFSFNYDTQEYAYQEIQKLLGEAIVLLKRTDGAVDQAYLARTDKMYNGDRAKWLKLAYGMMATNLNHYSNKASYKPDSVIAYVNLSFASNADDALLTYPATNNDDTNFYGRTRGNMTLYRPTQFVVNLLNGVSLGGGVDPRLSRMLAPAPDGVYRGLDINVVGFGALTTTQIPNNLHGYVGTGGLQLAGRYMFADKVRVPVMTYAQLQFVKAEAAYKMNDRATALVAYRNGISSHIDFVNERNLDNAQTPISITAAEKSAVLANVAIVPVAPAGLTLTRIMSQKYIAQWGWAHNEIWMDLRRYNYTGVDPEGAAQVFPGFTPPANLFADNGGKIVHRIRPRFNSEYVWNRPGLDAIGGLALDYHTKPLWITQP